MVIIENTTTNRKCVPVCREFPMLGGMGRPSTVITVHPIPSDFNNNSCDILDTLLHSFLLQQNITTHWLDGLHTQ